MNREAFLMRSSVRDFTQFFAHNLDGWQVEYVSRNPKAPPQFRRFLATGPTEALAQYCWPARFSDPLGEHFEITDWPSTKAALDHLSSELRRSLAEQGAATEVLGWCEAILAWGMGSRGEASLRFLAGLDKRGVGARQHLLHSRELLRLDNLDLGQISAETFVYMSSGLSKVHSLAADDGLIIFDSRVAAALGYWVNIFCREAKIASIPSELQSDAKPGASACP